jgi:hypothetical protein
VACEDSLHNEEYRHTDTWQHVFVLPVQYQCAVIIEKTLDLAGEYGTLEMSRVFVNKRLPQKVRLFKFLEGHLPIPITLLDQFSGKHHQDL